MGDEEDSRGTGSGHSWVIKWPDKVTGWALDEATSPDMTILNNEALGEVVHFFTSMLNVNKNSDLASINIMTY